jgi:O-6-methylguanine DNA methyltransferase
MQKQNFSGTICRKNGEKICKVGVVLTGDKIIEKIIFTPPEVELPLESIKPISENPALQKYIENAFYGFDDEFSHAPMAKTEFWKLVYEKLRAVPYGKRITYKELAEICQSPNAARAVGNALRNNPLPIMYPCHRVLATGGGLGGFAGNHKDWINIKEKFLFAEKNNERMIVL